MNHGHGGLWLLGMVVAVCLGGGANKALGSERRVVVTWNDVAAGSGRVAALDAEPPWAFTTPTLSVGLDSVLREGAGRIYAVSRSAGTITVIEPASFEVLHTFDLGPASEPTDIFVASPQHAYVTRLPATHLLRLDLQTGDMEEAVDLSLFADSDGVPDMNMMASFGDLLFVQIRRRNFELPGGFAPPAMLAVIDLNTNELIDADPATPGIQAIELQGTAAKLKMQVIPQTAQLFVSATGDFFDDGGLEIVDPTSLQSLGLVIAEAQSQTGADLGAFVLTTPQEGYLAFSTDFALSSHLKRFSIPGGVVPGPELHVSLGYFAPTIVHDPEADRLFWPEGTWPNTGVLVFDALSGALLTPDPIATSGQPTDLLLLDLCPADIDGDGAVGAGDLAILLGSWGSCPGCPADLNGDGIANAADLAKSLGNWGPCP